MGGSPVQLVGGAFDGDMSGNFVPTWQDAARFEGGAFGYRQGNGKTAEFVRLVSVEALADTNTMDVTRSVIGPLDTFLSGVSIAQGKGSWGDYFNVGMAALPGVGKIGGKFVSAAEGRLAGGTFDLGVSGSQYTLRAPNIAGFEGASGTISTRMSAVHGNSAASPRTAYLYELYNIDGTFLKNGITQNMQTRYTKGFMEDKFMKPIASGPRREMLVLERQRTVANPGPLNLEPWAVKARGGQ